MLASQWQADLGALESPLPGPISFIFIRGGPRIPRRSGSQPSVRSTYDFAKFSDNCMKLIKFLAVGVRAGNPHPQLRSATVPVGFGETFVK